MGNVVNTGKNVVKRAEKECPGKNFPGHRRAWKRLFFFFYTPNSTKALQTGPVLP